MAAVDTAVTVVASESPIVDDAVFVETISGAAAIYRTYNNKDEIMR